LPVHPSTIEELALIRFWLLRLSQIHIKELFAQGILNPEFLSVLNPKIGPSKILFHANNVIVDLRESEAAIPDFAQFLCARQIFLNASILDRNNLFKFITGTGNALEHFRIYYSESNQKEFCELLVNVNIEIHTFPILIFSKFDDLVPHARARACRCA
jgi:hypothetical protein